MEKVKILKTALAKVFCLGAGACLCVAGVATGAKAFTTHISCGYSYFKSDVKNYGTPSSPTATVKVPVGINVGISFVGNIFGGKFTIGGKSAYGMFGGSWKNFATDQYGNYLDSSSVSDWKAQDFEFEVSTRYERKVYSWMNKVDFSGIGLFRYDLRLAGIELPDSPIPYDNTYELWNTLTLGFGVKAAEKNYTVLGKKLNFIEEVDLLYPVYASMKTEFQTAHYNTTWGLWETQDYEPTFNLNGKLGYKIGLGCQFKSGSVLEAAYEVDNYKGDTQTVSGKTFSVGDSSIKTFEVSYTFLW
ncbi:MAG: hypothetical protein GXO57_02335 [Thermodesulfobacteria bacterium]|nr:hypothetical protein [Thermodesulfobacteriota bacterium]